MWDILLDVDAEHAPIYTLGVGGRAEHVLSPGAIPVVQTDRGGQVTYHGPGQVVAYPLVDLRRLGIYVKEYVYRLEHAVIKTLADDGVVGHRVAGAPGVYVVLDDPYGHTVLNREVGKNAASGAPSPFNGLAKIAALGVKLHKHCAYHGLALNVKLDLEPYRRIHPCGYADLATVDLATLGVVTDCRTIATRLAERLVLHLKR